MVIWIIGMSASGKTTIGKQLYEKVSESNKKWIFLDGDTFRNILGEDLGHSVQDRKKNAYRISRFCEFLNSYGINVVACVLSIFHDNQQYNKDNIEYYKEIYIDVDFDNLVKRDNKDLYKQALDGEIKNVVGVDIDFKPPFSPDLVIDNNKDNTDFEEVVSHIICELNIHIDDGYSYTKNNLLKNPHKYQYSKFEGKIFFQRYLKDRKGALDFLEARLDRFCEYDAKPIVSDEINDKDNLILKDYLISFYDCNEEYLNKNNTIFNLLIKRFEVSKKLYSTYSLSETRKSSSSYHDLINYPLFSLVLQKYYKFCSIQEDKLIYLNSILKVNDILSSIKEDMIFPAEIQYSIYAIEGEMDIAMEYL
jgi:cytidine diphosphoramidate kinase